MEQMVWVYFGIIAILIVLGIVANILVKYRTENKISDLQQNLEKLKARCDFVCGSVKDTRVSENVVLASGQIIEANAKKLCGKYESNTKCVLCNCNLKPYILNLNTTLARQSFDTHQYVCSFTRGQNNVEMECQG